MRPRRPPSAPTTDSGSAPAFGRRLRRGIAILYEDADLLVIDKPVGIITADPASSGDGGRRSARAGNTVFDILKEYVRAQSPSSRSGAHPPRAPRPRPDRGAPRERGPHSRDQGVWIIHRLDKEASGLLVFAKSLAAFNWLKEDLRAKRMQREYLAVTEGALGKPDETGTIQSFMHDEDPGRHEAPRSLQPRRADREPVDEGRLAVTHFKIVAATPERSLVRVRLDTGRKNQIRIHFADRGHPLVGDRKFGAKTNPLDRLALHAAELSFNHPATGQPLTFTSPAPPGFYRTVGAEPPAGTAIAAPMAATAQPAPATTAKVVAASPAPSPPQPPVQPPATREAKKPAELPAPTSAGPATSWDAVASWYDDLLEDRGNDHYEQVILPGTLRLLEPRPGLRVLDVACGQGILGRRLAALGVESLGIEASPRLVHAAERRSREERLDKLTTFRVGDARDLPAMELSGFDAATCIMALSNIEPLAPVFEGIVRSIRAGGRFVWVITHPAFRAPGQSDWGWDDKQKRQYRRVDGYLSPGQKPIDMSPGKSARGEKAPTTWSFHRPLQTYVEAMSAAGLLVEKLEEWPSLRASSSGPRAPEENRARREIPLFLGVRAVKR